MMSGLQIEWAHCFNLRGWLLLKMLEKYKLVKKTIREIKSVKSQLLNKYKAKNKALEKCK